jgi:hypothetical protein
MKQEVLAGSLGVTQQAVSLMVQSENIEDEKLSLIADALVVPKEAIQYFNEDAVIFHIENMNDNSANYQFNPLDKVVELYERIVKEKDEIIRQKDEVIEMYKQQQKAS